MTAPYTSPSLTTSSLWVNRKGYAQGVFWAIMVCLMSSMNDVLIRFSGLRLDPIQVAFLRTFFSVLTLIPFMLYKGRQTFHTKLIKIHTIRSIFLYGAIASWCIGVQSVPLTVVSTLAMTVPLFVLPMSAIFLREHVGWQRTLATITGFIGILITVSSQDTPLLDGLGIIHIDPSSVLRNTGVAYLLLATVLFAASDIFNKKIVSKENDLTIMFYISLGTSLIGLIPAINVWQSPNMTEYIFLFCLGGGANLILFCLLKAFAATDISALQPYRYVELIFAASFGYMFFSEMPTKMMLFGAALIIPSTFAIAYYETQLQKKNKA